MAKNLFTDYEGFTEKFKPKKTTDDCYTPEPVYRAVLDYVGTLTDLGVMTVRRPFWPGGDFEEESDGYGENDIVIDNPPFSILARILRHYQHRRVKFFLFAPALTLFSGQDIRGLTYYVTGATVVYENGAQVNTSFIGNLTPGTRIVMAGRLQRAIKAAQAQGKNKNALPKNVMPVNVVTAARLHRAIVPGEDWSIAEDSSIPVSECGSYRLFGGGYLVPTVVGQSLFERELSAEQREAVRKLDEIYNNKYI